jgi:hypothetical protein
MLTNLLNA